MYMDGILNLYKKIGETPLGRIERLRSESLEYKDATLSYAGRLDPVAEGVMLVLVGEENKNREKYLGLEKEYEFDVLWGVETDTYDVLGKITASGEVIAEPDKEKIKKLLERYKGKIKQKYPPYSSQPVKGRPLFEWARDGKIDQIEIPEKEIEIKEISLVSQSEISAGDLKKKILENIFSVKGDFRQEEIASGWNVFFANFTKHSTQNQSAKFYLSTFHATVTSGAYMRGLADSFGKELGVGAIAFRILRTRVGEYKVGDSLR